MAVWKGFAYLFACLCLANGYTCPEGGQTFYHAVVSTGCQVYHLCQGSVMTELSCPSGEAFDHHTNECREQSTVHCEETHTHHHRHKRSEEDVMVHPISLEKLKESSEKFYEAFITNVMQTLEEISPSMYSQIKDNYAPTVQKIKSDVMPFVNDRVKPRIMKGFSYTKKMGERVFHKLQKSWELSNSTHINLVSFSDLVNDVAKDLEPVVELGKFLSARLLPSSRVKRETSDSVTLHTYAYMLGFVEPVLYKVFDTVKGVLTGEEETITSKIILPAITEMVSDPETMFLIKRIVWDVKAVIAPIVSNMLRQQVWDSPRGLIVNIPQEQIAAYREKLLSEIKPLKITLLRKHLPNILRNLANNVNLLMDAYEKVGRTSALNTQVLGDSIVRFINKYYKMFSKSDDEYAYSYSVTEIIDDIKPIEITVLQIFLEYITDSPNSLLSTLFNPNSFVQRFTKNAFATPKDRSSLVKKAS